MASSDNGAKLTGDVAGARAFHVAARGRVQGVGFRWWVCRAAERFDVQGWVANCPDGSVEIFAEGDEGDLELFLMEAEKGPPHARVDSFVKSPAEPEGFRDFSIRG